MINQAVGIIRDELNAYLGRKETRYRAADTVIISDLVSPTGDFVITRNDEESRDNVIITLVNIEEETTGKSQLPRIKKDQPSYAVANPEIKINLYLMFSAFSNMSDSQRYTNCLSLISLVIQCFQDKHLFNSQNTPALDPRLDSLIIEMTSPSFEQQNHIWGSLGAKYMPSVMYKVRTLVIQETDDAPDGPLIQTISTRSQSRS